MQPNACWETFLEAVPSRQGCPCSLYMNSTVMEMLVQIQDTWHGGCLQTSWLEANFYPLLKIKSRHASVILLFDFMSCQCVFFTNLRAETLKPFPFPCRQTDRQCGRGARGTGDVGVGFTRLGVLSAGRWAIHPAKPLACSIYGNTTDTSENPRPGILASEGCWCGRRRRSSASWLSEAP